MRTKVILFLMFNTLVLISFANAARQSEIEIQSPFQIESDNENKNLSDMESLSVTPVSDLFSRKMDNELLTFGPRSLGIDFWYFNGLVGGDAESLRRSLFLINLESTFRTDFNSYYQIGAAFSESNGVFFHGSQLWSLPALSIAKPFWRVSFMNTSAPNQALSSVFNYKNINLGLGFGFKDLEFIYKGAEINLDVFMSSLGINYLFGVGYCFGF